MRTLKALWISALVVAVAFAAATFAPQPAAAAGATCTWNGSAGNWNDAARWSCLAVPGVGDTAIINAGTVTLTADVTVGGLTLSTGTLGGSGALTVTDRFNWTSGTLTSTVPGTAFVLAPGSVMTVAGSIDLNGRTFNS